MSFALIIPVKESLTELRSSLKKASVMLQPRIKMLIAIKRAGESGISKRALMDSVGASSQSIHNWRTAYKTGGLEALLQNGRKGKSGKPSVFTRQEHDRIAKKLKGPKNGLAGFVELQQWIKQEFKKEVKYNTVLKYAIRHFGASVKVAGKSQVNKDSSAVDTFKKTSRNR
jgi:transposase